ncbi:uncharacterized protein LOC113318960 [Papaver somniferum]|uniref:uncharacterized protein LOC113318960 n=1 Tax=Papaver somniferum TaxID=3469 RepID=UPI000E6FAF75|nr:uncharacterized protein LOC113318960 [Papaver somniferum]XP_026423044.1 uncharacterized protein LOC113318960 [Papaver somniferum]XP_026423045.1 uncharacterized protein LOC113318960 [Papaver somniferum]
MGMCESLLEITISDIDSGDDEQVTLKTSEVIPTDNNVSAVRVAGSLAYSCQSVVMESFGEVFKIDRYHIPRGVYRNFLTSIDIAKLDFSSMAWEEVSSLDDYVFFLGDNNQLSCLAQSWVFPGVVYFTQDGEISLYKYDLEDKSVSHCLPCPDIPTPWSSPEWLMISAATPRVDDFKKTRNHVLGKEAEIATRATVTSVDKDAEIEHIEEAIPSFMDNDDTVRLISDRLHTVEYMHLRAVSKKYRSMLNLRRSPSRTVRTTGLSPWLFFAKYDQPVYNFVSPMHNNENYLVHIPEVLRGSTVRFSKDVWLLMLKDKTLFFYNPLSKSIVGLPDLPDDCNLSGISFSSLPTSSDCIVFGIDRFVQETVEITFIRRGDEDWKNYHCNNIYLPPIKTKLGFEPNFNSPVFHRGAFYCLDLNGTLGVFKLENGTSWEILAMVAQPKCEFIYKSFLVECESNLLCVLLGRLGKWVRIFRLNNDAMVWVEVKHLGRHMLFISHTSSISAIAPTVQMENKIYFPRLHDDGIIFYSLDTCLYHCLGCKHSAKDYGNSKENLVCSWIEPNCSETPSDQYLDWFNF